MEQPLSEFANLLCSAVRGFVSLSDDQIAQMEAHYNLLKRWNQRLNLTAIKSLEEAVLRHYGESVFLASVVRRFGPNCSAVDIGSGAGFPGIPLAIVLPGWQITLVESHQRKAVFLKESARHLSNVTVMARRFDDTDGIFDLAVSRAVAWSDLAGVLRTRTRKVALLAARADIDSIRKTDGFTWNDNVSPPWDEDTVVVVGST